MSASLSDPFSSGHCSWLGAEQAQDSSFDSADEEKLKKFQKVLSALKDEGIAQWSMQRDGLQKAELRHVQSRFKFTDR